MLKYANKRVQFGRGLININFLVNYDWNWDLNSALSNPMKNIRESVASVDISRIDLLIRWGGRRRISGFLPIQTVYSDIYVIDDYWPDFSEKHFTDALNWYQSTDVTLGG